MPSWASQNTLMRLAMENAGLPAMGDVLSGPSAFIFAERVIRWLPQKSRQSFAAKNDKLVIKGGVMEGTVYDASQVEAIASLPSREQLYGQRGLVPINAFCPPYRGRLDGHIPAGLARAQGGGRVSTEAPAA